MPLVLTQIEDPIATLTLNHPQKRNALSIRLIDDLIAGLRAAAAARVRVAILRAAEGVSVWSAGHDIGELGSGGNDPQGYTDPLRRAVRAIEAFPAPVIALVEGGVWGGACEIVLSCDLIVAAQETTFAITPAKLGVAYSLDGTLNLMKSVGLPLLREMLLTAAPISAERALAGGAINRLVPRNELEPTVYDLAARIARNSPLCVSLLKEELRILAQARSLTPDAFERIQELRRQLYDSRDFKEGIEAFFAKRTPDFKGN